MRRLNAAAVAATFALCILAVLSVPARAQVTVFEGARLIVGDGRAPIENATLVVDGARIAQVGAAASVSVPAGATRVSLAGKTVMPTIIDTHTHLSTTPDALTRDLKRRGYFGVGAALSLGTDPLEILSMRGQTIPGAARYFSAGKGITAARTRAPDVPDQHRGGRPQGRAGARGAQGRHRQGLGRRPGGQGPEGDT